MRIVDHRVRPRLTVATAGQHPDSGGASLRHVAIEEPRGRSRRSHELFGGAACSVPHVGDPPGRRGDHPSSTPFVLKLTGRWPTRACPFRRGHCSGTGTPLIGEKLDVDEAYPPQRRQAARPSVTSPVVAAFGQLAGKSAAGACLHGEQAQASGRAPVLAGCSGTPCRPCSQRAQDVIDEVGHGPACRASFFDLLPRSRWRCQGFPSMKLWRFSLPWPN